MERGEVSRLLLLLLLRAVVVGCVQVQDHAAMLSSERTTIERTYELTKYLDHQLKEIKDTYLSYLGPPFSDPGFSPPRPNISFLSVPSAATRVDLWRGLENGVRLAQNQRAYSVLLSAVRELARSTLCPYLQSSLLHFCSGLSGLLGSISGLMNALGYTPPLQGNGVSAHRYGPPMTLQQKRLRQNGPVPLRGNLSRITGNLTASGTPRIDADRKKQRDRERGRRGRRREGESWPERGEEEEERDEGLERWGRRRKLLSFANDPKSSNNNNDIHVTVEEEEHRSVPLLFTPPSLHHQRSGRSLHPPSTLSPLPLPLLYSDPERPALNDFTRKVEGFWVLRELQSWLWRSAKDFTRLKKRLRN
ncbi:uncharacterized protein clcf1 [Hoplias malabaricus]|uniref:uncharacterized protein clcf1 n=1 Tax=Hoplias malabaricus TaxID=27720 RepID=UPI00346301CC